MAEFAELSDLVSRPIPRLTPEQFQGNRDALTFVRATFLPPDVDPSTISPEDPSPVDVWFDEFVESLKDDETGDARLYELVQSLQALAAVNILMSAALSGKHPYDYITDMLEQSEAIERQQADSNAWVEAHADDESPSNFYVPEAEHGGEA